MSCDMWHMKWDMWHYQRETQEVVKFLKISTHRSIFLWVMIFFNWITQLTTGRPKKKCPFASQFVWQRDIFFWTRSPSLCQQLPISPRRLSEPVSATTTEYPEAFWVCVSNYHWVAGSCWVPKGCPSLCKQLPLSHWVPGGCPALCIGFREEKVLTPVPGAWKTVKKEIIITQKLESSYRGFW